MLHARRLALGTAQLGLRYGIANRAEPPTLDEARDILRCARGAGVDTVDTAIAYGNSEQVLGSVGVHGLRIVTKLPQLASEKAAVAGWVRTRINESLRRLGIEQLYGLLLHCPSDLFGSSAHELLTVLRALKEEGLVRKIGVSIYDPAELDRLVPLMDIELVQVPYNVFDRRVSESGWLDRLHRQGVEVHVRSVFLQGLLLMNESDLPSGFAVWRPIWSKWHAWVREQGVTSLEASLGFILRSPQIDRIVVGVESAAQFTRIVASARVLDRDVPREIASNELDLIDPTRWKKT